MSRVVRSRLGRMLAVGLVAVTIYFNSFISQLILIFVYFNCFKKNSLNELVLLSYEYVVVAYS